MNNNNFDILNYDIAKFDINVEFNYHFYDEETEDINPINDEMINLKIDNSNMNMSNKIVISLKDLKQRVFYDSNISFIEKIDDNALSMIKNYFQSLNLNISEFNGVQMINYFNSNISFEDKSMNFISNLNEKNRKKILNSFNISPNQFSDLTKFNQKNITYGTNYLSNIIKSKERTQYGQDFSFNELLKNINFSESNNGTLFDSENIKNDNITHQISLSSETVNNFLRNKRSSALTTNNNDNTPIIMQFKPFFVSAINEDESIIKNETGVAFVGFLIKKNIKDFKTLTTKFNVASQFVYVDYKNFDVEQITLYDGFLKYTNSYSYEISPVFYVGLYNFEGYDIFNFPLISHNIVYTHSKYTSFIKAIDFSTPEPPSGFIAKFIPELFKAELTWCNPTNPQGDIVGFQIYRRESLTEAFKLIKMYLIKEKSEFKYMDFFSDNVDPSIIKISDTRSLDIEMFSFIDNAVDLRKKTYIYAICSIDAHGYVSNYSSQIALRYSKIYNNLIIDKVSDQNAPRSYPNLYIQRKSQLFEYDDMLFDLVPSFKNKEKIKIYFTPDALNLYDKNTPDSLVKTFDINNKYQLTVTRIKDLITKNILFNFSP